MKKTAWILAILAMAALSASAGGGFGLYGTWWDTSDADAGYGGGIKLKGEFGDLVALEARASGVAYFDDENPEYEDMRIFPLELGLVFQVPLGDSLGLYAGGGAGYYVMPEHEIHRAMGSSLEPDIDRDDTWGWYGVAGVELGLSDTVALFAEAKYTALEVDGATIDDVDVDIDEDFSGFGVQAGLLFTW